MTLSTQAARKYRRRMNGCLAQFLILLLIDVVLLVIFDDNLEQNFFRDAWVWIGTVPIALWSLGWFFAVARSGERVLFRDCDVAGYAEIHKVDGTPYFALPAAKWQSALLVDFYSGQFARVLTIESKIKTFYVRQNCEILLLYAMSGYYAQRYEAIREARGYFDRGVVAGRGSFAYRFADAAISAVHALTAGDAAGAEKLAASVEIPSKVRIYGAIRDVLSASARLECGDTDGARIAYAKMTEYGDTYFAFKAKNLLS